ncbi:DNA pilot protein [Blackfly microvirus SF02]|uniref:DNA pilot protein n=1 Tax=Blackfly microvirus SF02 TaxID=2576452 RepID=A0A4V1F5F4_9VIRU|nr:DNA pilot protein [Blackfly microvirus SF02]
MSGIEAALIAGAAALGSAGLSYAGGAARNQASSAQAMASNLFELGSMRESNAYNQVNAQQAQQFDAEQGAIARGFNAAEADKSRFFAATEGDVAYDRTAQQAALAREFDANAMNQQQAFQERMASQAQSFSAQMSNSAYQRAMADMRAAGLNPMLAYSQGGASSPVGVPAAGGLLASPSPSATPVSGPMASGQNVSGPSAAGAPSARGHMADIHDALSGALNTGFNAAGAVGSQFSLAAGLKKTESEIAVNDALASRTRLESITEAGKPEVQNSENLRLRAAAELARLQGGEAAARTGLAGSQSAAALAAAGESSARSAFISGPEGDLARARVNQIAQDMKHQMETPGGYGPTEITGWLRLLRQLGSDVSNAGVSAPSAPVNLMDKPARSVR